MLPPQPGGPLIAILAGQDLPNNLNIDIYSTIPKLSDVVEYVRYRLII
jgi:hypothetical protein